MSESEFIPPPIAPLTPEFQKEVVEPFFTALRNDLSLSPYFVVADPALYPKGALPSELAQVFLRGIPTSPLFADNEKGRQRHGLWDPGMRTLIRQGKLAEIYRQNKLYDYYQDFLREQVVRANKPQP